MMLEVIKQVSTGLLSFSRSLATKCVSLHNEPFITLTIKCWLIKNIFGDPSWLKNYILPKENYDLLLLDSLVFF